MGAINREKDLIKNEVRYLIGKSEIIQAVIEKQYCEFRRQRHVGGLGTIKMLF